MRHSEKHTVRCLEDFTVAVSEALGADELSTIIAKVEATGPRVYVTDLTMLENRFEFSRCVRDRASRRAPEQPR